MCGAKELKTSACHQRSGDAVPTCHYTVSGTRRPRPARETRIESSARPTDGGHTQSGTKTTTSRHHCPSFRLHPTLYEVNPSAHIRLTLERVPRVQKLLHTLNDVHTYNTDKHLLLWS